MLRSLSLSPSGCCRRAVDVQTDSQRRWEKWCPLEKRKNRACAIWILLRFFLFCYVIACCWLADFDMPTGTNRPTTGRFLLATTVLASSYTFLMHNTNSSRTTHGWLNRGALVVTGWEDDRGVQQQVDAVFPTVCLAWNGGD